MQQNTELRAPAADMDRRASALLDKRKRTIEEQAELDALLDHLAVAFHEYNQVV